MASSESGYPDFFSTCFISNEEAMKRVVHSGARIASGFATSEPHTFYDALWDFIQREDIHDLHVRQALFMAPHKFVFGSALESRGRFARLAGHRSPLGSLAKKIHATTRKMDGVARLVAHYEELLRRNIRITSAFVATGLNIVIPDNPLFRVLYPTFVGRNTTRMGITDMQSVHFPDGVDSMGYDADDRPIVDTFVQVLTPPDAQGEMSLGPSNGANADILEKIIRNGDIRLLLYVNDNYPFVRGYGDAPNTVNIAALAPLARAGRLLVVADQAPVPSFPKDFFANPAPEELAIAQHVVNHIEMNRRDTHGRAIQVGIGQTGVQAIRKLRESSWHGRSYTEMLEPFTLDLFESGKIAGSHFIERDGRRTPLDGRLVCTFSICEQGSDFYQRLHNNPAIVMAAASRVVISEGFYYGLGINNCLAVDFQGHVNSAGRDLNHYSGVGGGAMIFRGLARGGIGYLCLKSTHRTPEGKLRSSIFPFLPPGTPISHIGPDLMGGREGARFFLVTEHGLTQLSGQSQSHFIRNLISVADPRFRDWLKREAYQAFRVS